MSAKDQFEGLESIPKLLRRNAHQIGNLPAYRFKDLGIWQSWTWAQTEAETEALALGLLDLGLAVGDHVAIIGRNRPQFYWSMVAIQMAGGVPVPVYQDSVAEEMAYVLEHCGARFIIAENQEQVDKVLEIQGELPLLEQMVYLDPRGLRKYDHGKLHSFEDIQERGRNSNHASELTTREAALTRDTTCVMLYTSGTTGRPKGVVLSNLNIIATAAASSEFDNLNKVDSVLAYLPMAWVGDFIFSIGQAYWTGFCVACPESAETMQADLREIGPTYFFAPPRFFEGLLTTVMIRMEDAGDFKRGLFKHFMKFAGTCSENITIRAHEYDPFKRTVGTIFRTLVGSVFAALTLISNARRTLWVWIWNKLGGNATFVLKDTIFLQLLPKETREKVKYWAGEVLVFGPLKNTLGLSRVRVGYTAGEAIGPEIFEFYRSLGINLKQLYGQTEAGVFITQQPDGEVRSDTVGVASPGVELRIDETGEVFYRSPGVFQEYYKNPESTASTKDAEGWVATGDAGFIEESTGHLRIIDRAKDVGKTADGRMFAPKYVENKLKFYPNILEAVVFGNERERCCAFLNIDLTAVGNWAERNNIAYASYQELAGHPRVLDALQAHVEEVNRSVAEDEMLSGCQIHRFVVLHKQLDADDGELTRTQKVRRRIIEEKYGDIIAALYDGAQTVSTETEVTYEDGRKGSIKATLNLRDAAIIQSQNVAAE